VRNLVKRRLRYLAAEALRIHPVGADVVVRALAPAATADFDQLRAAWNQATSKASSQ
jgi:ribonuclease P protein component